MKIGFIGAGNMAEAIIGGIREHQVCRPEDILASRRSVENLQLLEKKYGIRGTTSNCEVVQNSEVLFLSVKPQMLPEVLKEIHGSIREEQLIVSIAAGKTLQWFGETLGKEKKLVRCMPNTPALVGEGCTGICYSEGVTEAEKELIQQIFNSCGICVEVPESLMDVVGAVSGSSPAYVFMFIEAMADAAVADGMPRNLALKMASQAVLGSARMVLEMGKHPGELKDMVCSPGGTTICGVKALEQGGMRASVMEALNACVEKSRTL